MQTVRRTPLIFLSFSLLLAAISWTSTSQADAVDRKFTLYKNEAYQGGSEFEEKKIFSGQSTQVQQVQVDLSKELGLERGRVFHRKSHGCLTGKLYLKKDRPQKTRRGLFADGLVDSKGTPRTYYNVLAHFTNASMRPDHDLAPDARGLAFKIFGVNDPKYPNLKMVDINMTNGQPFGRDQEEFVQLMLAMAKPTRLIPNDLLLEFLLTPVYQGRPDLEHLIVAKRVLDAALTHVDSMAEEPYWAGHGYLWGQDQAVKINVNPSMGAHRIAEAKIQPPPPERQTLFGQLKQRVEKRITNLETALERIDPARQLEEIASLTKRFEQWKTMKEAALKSEIRPNYLREELAARARKEPIQFELRVQFEVDPKTTPLENELVFWSEGVTPSVAVGEIVLEQQDFNEPLHEAMCDQLGFTPGNFFTDHRPLGNMGRGRIYTYRASQMGRGIIEDLDADELFERLRKRGEIS